MTIKLTKTELRTQQQKHDQLQRYLPTLQLKKALLQMEVERAEEEIRELMVLFQQEEERIATYAGLFTDRRGTPLFMAVKVERVETASENIAGVEIPIFKKVHFEKPTYSLFDTPIWLEAAVAGVHELISVRERIRIAEEKKRALEKELREVSIRVNLFEKVLIPRADRNIRRIRIFLGDQQLAAVAQAKVSKKKIYARKRKQAVAFA